MLNFTFVGGLSYIFSEHFTLKTTQCRFIAHHKPSQALNLSIIFSRRFLNLQLAPLLHGVYRLSSLSLPPPFPTACRRPSASVRARTRRFRPPTRERVERKGRAPGEETDPSSADGRITRVRRVCRHRGTPPPPSPGPGPTPSPLPRRRN